MSPWRQSLRQGSFRGVKFFTKSAASDQGRRTAVHEYPLRDVPFVEDLGRKGRAFTLEAYVIGTNYMVARDALIAVLEQPGAGELVHPYRGALTVALISPAHITESADEGGMARFSLSFIETADAAQPSVQPDTPALVAAAADAANTATSADAAAQFNVAGATYLADAASAVANGALDGISALANVATTGPLSELMHSAQIISGSLATLMGTPAMLVAAIQGQVYALAALVNTPLDAYNAMRQFLNGNGTPTFSVPLTTPSRIQQSINQSAITDLVRRTAIVEAARASSQITFGSYNDALAAQTWLASALDAELASTPVNPDGSSAPLADGVYDALLELRAAAVRDLSTRGASLAKLTTLTLPRTLPALVVAHRVYGDCTMDADIVARNPLRHPGFLPGGIPLEILSA